MAYTIPAGEYIVGFDKDLLAADSDACWTVYPNAAIPAAYGYSGDWPGIPLTCGNYLFFPFIPTGGSYVRFLVFNPAGASFAAYTDSRQWVVQGPDGYYYTVTETGYNDYAYNPRTRTWRRRTALAPVYIPPWVSGGHIIQTIINSMW